jgi:hypothetical protein
MFRFSGRDLAALLLIAFLAAGWAWDHIRTTGKLRRCEESEQYFRSRLFEYLEGKPIPEESKEGKASR